VSAPVLARPLPFAKLTGSGNDFVFVDARTDPALEAVAMDPAVIAAACDRRFGVGADGVVVLRPDATLPFRIRYFNADGTQANLCGNATLCTVRLRLTWESSILRGSPSGATRGRCGAGFARMGSPRWT